MLPYICDTKIHLTLHCNVGTTLTLTEDDSMDSIPNQAERQRWLYENKSQTTCTHHTNTDECQTRTYEIWQKATV